MAGEKGRADKRPLTAAFVNSVEKPGKYYDGLNRHGLCLRVMGKGSKHWIQRFSVGGQRVDRGLGPLRLYSLAQARKMAAENWHNARTSGEPLPTKKEIKEAAKAAVRVTFENAVLQVHELNKPSWTNAKHAQDFLNSLTTYAFPILGSRDIKEISSGDIMAVLAPIWLDKPETARRVHQRIKALFDWVIAEGYRVDNPAASVRRGLPKQPRIKAHRKALPYNEVAGCIAAVHGSNAYAATKLAIEFLILTASRSGNVRNARWDQIRESGEDAPVWIIPAAETKRKDKEHRVPLSPRAMEILREAKSLPGKSGLLFPSKSDRPLSDMTLSKLVKELGFDADIHGFRTSFRTWGQEQTNHAREIQEAALHHAVGDTSEQSYARSDVLGKRRKLMDHWASYIALRRGDVVKLAR